MEHWIVSVNHLDFRVHDIEHHHQIGHFKRTLHLHCCRKPPPFSPIPETARLSPASPVPIHGKVDQLSHHPLSIRTKCKRRLSGHFRVPSCKSGCPIRMVCASKCDNVCDFGPSIPDVHDFSNPPGRFPKPRVTSDGWWSDCRTGVNWTSLSLRRRWPGENTIHFIHF